MANIQDTISYICSNYPPAQKHRLSKARLTKLVYLSDWKSAIEYERQITPIKWIFNHYGPYVTDVLNTAEQHPDRFRIVPSYNDFGTPKDVVEILTPHVECPSLSDQDKSCIDHVINVTSGRTWADFIRLVYSTYPVMTSERFATLDLIELAKAYTNSKELES